MENPVHTNHAFESADEIGGGDSYSILAQTFRSLINKLFETNLSAGGADCTQCKAPISVVY